MNIHDTALKTSFTGLLLFLLTIYNVWGQAGSTKVTITGISFYSQKKGKGLGGSSEYRFKYYVDNQAVTPCHRINSKRAGWFYDPDYTVINNKLYSSIPGRNGTQSQIDLKVEMWEEDRGGDCDYNNRDDYHVSPTTVPFNFYRVAPGKNSSRTDDYYSDNQWKITYYYSYTPPQPNPPTASKSGIVCVNDAITLSTNTYVNPTFHDQVRLYWQYWVNGDYYTDIFGIRRQRWRSIGSHTMANVNGGKKTFTPKDLAGLGGLTTRKQVYFRVRGYANGTYGDYSANKIIKFDPPGPSFNVSPVKASCATAGTGSISITNASGAGSYRYVVIKNGETTGPAGPFNGSTKTVTGLLPGTYTVRLSNRRSGASILSTCDITKTVTVGRVSSIHWNSSTRGFDPFCPTSTGSIYVNVNGGDSDQEVTFTITGGHSFSRSGTAYDRGYFRNLPAGSYTVTAHDPCNNTTITRSFTLTPRPAIVATVSSDHPKCSAPKDGSISVTVSSGPGKYDYELWSGGSRINDKSLSNTTSTAHTFTGLSSGVSYQVRVYDDARRSCTPFTQNVTLSFTPLSITSFTKSDISCAGETGAINVVAAGGSGSYDYTLAHSSGSYTQTNTTGSFTVDRGGEYTVTVRNRNYAACNDVVSRSATIIEPAPLAATVAQQDITCSGVYDGNLTAVVTGGTPPYSYQWQERDHSSATWYNYTRPGAQTSEIGQLYDAQYQLIVTDKNGCEFTTPEHILTDPDPLSLDEVTVTHITCRGANDGQILATASGGWGGYTFQYQREGESAFTSFTKETPLPAGTYRIQVTDQEGCVVPYPDPLTINEPAQALALDYQASDYNGYHLTCFDGNDGWIEAVATGGNGAPFGTAYEFSLDGGGFTPEARFTGLSRGAHELRVRDERGCIVSQTITLSSPDELTLSTSDKNYIQCYGDSTGYLTVLAQGGVPPYVYRRGANDWQISPSFTDLPAGNYQLIVKDSRGCETLLNESVTSNDSLEIVFNKTDVQCYGLDNGRITASGIGGRPPYQFVWKQGASTKTRIDALAPAWYTVTVTDAEGCVRTDSVLIEEPEAVLLTTPVATPIRCFGEDNGMIALPTGGGTPPYRYSLDGGVTFQHDSLFAGLAPGTYPTLTADIRGCEFTSEATIVEPSLLELSLAGKTDILCHGEATGQIRVLATGGTEPYRYSADGTNWQTGALLTDLVAKDYTVRVQDARGCETSISVTLIEPEAPLQLTYDTTPVRCKGTASGAIRTTVTGGTAPYQYQWETLAVTTPALDGLVAGEYVLTITDAHDCQRTDTIAVTEPEVALTGLVIDQRNVSCFGLSDGQVQLGAEGGYPPYRYAWQGGSFSSVTAYDDLSAGSYPLIVRDARNCEVAVEVVITQPDELVARPVVVQHVQCQGGSDAKFRAEVSGGTQPYRYSLDGGTSWQSEALFDGYPIGTYTISVTDMLGCQTSTSVTITEPPLLSATIENMVEAACAQANGEAQAVAQGGTFPYRYIWINRQGETVSEEAYPTNLRANVYDVYVTDANNCQVHLTQIINDLDGPTSQITSAQDASCFTSLDGTATVAATGGTGSYAYRWDDPLGQTTATATNLARGDYFVSVTDERGCVSIASVTIGSPDAFQLDTLQWKAPSCYEACDGQLELAVSGGVAPYTYRWDNRSETGLTLNGLCQGAYTLTVTDAVGCTLRQPLVIIPPDPLRLTISEVQAPTCFSGCDGQATVSVRGGTAPYQYRWDDAGQDAATATNLCPGSYTVNVTDAQGCQAQLPVTIAETPRIAVSLPETVTLCVDQEVTLDATVPRGSYQWTRDGAAYSNAPQISVTEAGEYEVIVTTPRDCQQVARTQVVSYDTLFEANFLQTTELYVGDTLTLTEVCYPMPDSVQWRYSGGAKVLSLSPWEPQITFEEAGTYQVTLTGYYSVCTDSITKTVAFFPPRQDLPSDGRVAQGPQGIKTVAISPNPTTGRFRVEVTLYSVTALFVHLNDMSGHEIERVRQKNSDHYTFDFDLNGYASGQYFLRLMSEHDKKVARILLR